MCKKLLKSKEVIIFLRSFKGYPTMVCVAFFLVFCPSYAVGAINDRK